MVKVGLWASTASALPAVEVFSSGAGEAMQVSSLVAEITAPPGTGRRQERAVRAGRRAPLDRPEGRVGTERAARVVGEGGISVLSQRLDILQPRTVNREPEALLAAVVVASNSKFWSR